MNSRLKKSSGLYLISPECADTKALCAQIKPLLDYPIAFLQYRNKTATFDVKRQQILALFTLCQSSGVPLIINDDWQLALECGADGVHLGSDDAEPAWVRNQIGPDMLIGVSCYNSFERAQAMAKLDVDYLAFGAMFTS
ncbi:MAG: thiamine phosphate synthase, partial [Arenimonas sp.]|nr:thiamine phosphate synthase [Arenimonas sp.]